MSVFTAVRLHPTEQSDDNWHAVTSDTIAHGGKEHRFDHVFSGQDNTEVYNASCREIVEQVLKGYNGTIAAYGQSGSGKTHSLLGTSSEEGILQMAVQHLLELIEQRVSVQYMVKLSAIEVYNENIADLMDSDSTKVCRLIDDKVINKKEEIIESYEHFIELCHNAQDRRKVGSTLMNMKSSRSHALFELVVESCNLDVVSGKQMTTASRLTILDLAGSENTRTMANAVQSVESKKINLSLLALSRVISILADKPKNMAGIPFRESVLTRMLKKVLGGNSQFLLFCCIKKEACTETASTISFGQQAKKMPNVAKKNVATESGAITALMAEIGDLKRQLEEQKKEAAADQDKQRLEELFKKVLNSRPEGSTPKVAKPKRRHSIAFGGNRFMDNMNRRPRHSEELDWNALFRLDEDDALVPDSGRSSRMSGVELESSRPVTPENGLNQQSVQTDGFWVEKTAHDELQRICAEVKQKVTQLEAQLMAQSEELLQKENLRLETVTENEKLRNELHEKGILYQNSVFDNEKLHNELIEQQKLKELALGRKEELEKLLLCKESLGDNTTNQLEEMKKKLKRAEEVERSLNDKYINLKQRGLGMLDEKKAEILSQKNAYETKMKEQEEQKEALQTNYRKVVDDGKLKDKFIIELKTENSALHEKIEEMRVVKRGVIYKEPCQDADHIRLFDKLDTLQRQNGLLAENIVTYREELSKKDDNATVEQQDVQNKSTQSYN